MSLALLGLLGAAHAGWGGFTPEERADAPPPSRLDRAYAWYRQRSSTDGAVCPYYPTCSGYGRLAVTHHGVAIGGLLTLDRMLREYPGMEDHDHYPFISPHGSTRLHDPVPPARERRQRD